MELFSNLSDDQIALLGCATALMATGTLMSLSYFIGRNRMHGNAALQRVPMEIVDGMGETVLVEYSDESKRRTAA
jgi:hypothetical protein